MDMRNDEKTFPVDRVPASAGGWADYPMGVVWAFHERRLRPSGLHAVFTSDVPVGAGMSSSAAVELAFAYAWNQLSGFGIELPQLALLCQRAENMYVGVNCGIMDQMISACGKAGHAMLLDTRTLERSYYPVPNGVAIVVADSQVRRALTGSEYNIRRTQCEQAVAILREDLPGIKALRDVSVQDLQRLGQRLPEDVLRRARHVVTEDDRVMKFTAALQRGDLGGVGALMIEGHQSLRDDYEVSIPELDTLVHAATEVEGCYGARLTGAGFGGCIVALANEQAVPELEKHLRQVYQQRHAIDPTVYVTRAADGVGQIPA
jgi:galactokinase